MKLTHHIAVSTAVSGLIYSATRSFALTAASFIAGIFIDLDHIIDVMREHGGKISIKDFFSICNNAQFQKILLICHGWEWLLIGSLVAWYSHWNPWIVGALIGFTHHMVLDSIYNSSNPLTYSLLYRWKNDFVFDAVFTKLVDHKYNSQ